MSNSLVTPGTIYSLPGSSVHGILQARVLEWVAISFSRGSSQPRDQTHVSCTGRWILVGHPGSPHVHLCCCSVTQLCPTLCDHMDCSTSGFLSFTISRSLRKLVSIELVMPSNHLIFCYPLLLRPSIFPSIRVFSNESVLLIRWPKYWSFSFNISPSSEYSGLISFRMDWLDPLAVLQHHSSKASIL